MKTCKGCLKTLDYEKFYWDETMKDGYHNYCKKCSLERQKARRAEKKRNSFPKPRKTNQKILYSPSIAPPPNPKHAIQIEMKPIQIVFD